jgi:hypothetical protein
MQQIDLINQVETLPRNKSKKDDMSKIEGVILEP